MHKTIFTVLSSTVQSHIKFKMRFTVLLVLYVVIDTFIFFYYLLVIILFCTMLYDFILNKQINVM